MRSQQQESCITTYRNPRLSGGKLEAGGQLATFEAGTGREEARCAVDGMR